MLLMASVVMTASPVDAQGTNRSHFFCLPANLFRMITSEVDDKPSGPWLLIHQWELLLHNVYALGVEDCQGTDFRKLTA